MPDATQNQVSARQVSYTTNSQSQTEVATGSGTNPATYATGTITFTNGANYSQTFPAGIVFTDNNNIQFTNDEAANLAPLGSATVSAHALVAGPSGNVPIGDINTGSADSHVGMYNNVPFTGGQNAQPYTFVQQSDIDGATTPLKQSLTQSAQASFQQAIHPNEQLLTSPQCTTSVASNHTAGDKASSVTVTVSATCSGEVYDRVAALAMTKTLFASDTTLVPYTITGAISTTILKAILADAKQGTLSLLTQARGTGTYQFNEAQKSNLAQLVAGKSFQDAKNVLLTEEGVSNVTISGANGKILPQDTRLITIIITEQATK
jgi:hypothetical protein